MKTKASVPTVPTVPTIFNNYIYRKIYVFLQCVLLRVGKIIFSGNVGTKCQKPSNIKGFVRSHSVGTKWELWEHGVKK